MPTYARLGKRLGKYTASKPDFGRATLHPSQAVRSLRCGLCVWASRLPAARRALTLAGLAAVALASDGFLDSGCFAIRPYEESSLTGWGEKMGYRGWSLRLAGR